jgi:putative membrane protein
MRLVVQVLLNGVGVVAAAYVLPGIHWSGGLVALLVAGIVLGLINLIVKPIVTVLSCPLLVVTLGLFYLIINGAMLALADLLLDALRIDGFLWAVLGGLFLALFNLLVRALLDPREA